MIPRPTLFHPFARLFRAGPIIFLALATAAAGPIRDTQNGASSGSEASAWKEFASAKYGFTVHYPADWYPLAGLSDILDITNFERSGPQDGIASRVGGAEITVTGALSGVQSVDDWIRRDLPDSDDLGASEADVKIAHPVEAGCIKLKLASWHEPLSPDASLSQTSFYCTAAKGLYRISLLNWENDPRQKGLRELVLGIALSLKTR